MKYLTLLLLMVILSACSNTEQVDSIVEIDGVLILGPEQFSFAPCNDTQRWWVSTIEGDGWEQVEDYLGLQGRCDLSTMPCALQTAGVTGQAVISNVGQYGHQGAYLREIDFAEVRLKVDNEGCELAW